MHGRKNIKSQISLLYFYYSATAPSGAGPPRYRSFTITLKCTTFCRIPLTELSALRRYLYLKTHSTHKIQTSMPLAGFEPAVPACERPQTHALDPATTGILPSDTVWGLRKFVLSIRKQWKVYQRTWYSQGLSTISVVESVTTISGHPVDSVVYYMTGNILVHMWRLRWFGRQDRRRK